jgi:hypothetical protein
MSTEIRKEKSCFLWNTSEEWGAVTTCPLARTSQGFFRTSWLPKPYKVEKVMHWTLILSSAQLLQPLNMNPLWPDRPSCHSLSPSIFCGSLPLCLCTELKPTCLFPWGCRPPGWNGPHYDRKKYCSFGSKYGGKAPGLGRDKWGRGASALQLPFTKVPCHPFLDEK